LLLVDPKLEQLKQDVLAQHKKSLFKLKQMSKGHLKEFIK